MATNPTDPFGGLAGPNRDAFAAILGALKNYGLESLASTVLGYIQQGYTSDTISILLPETPAYKQRFSANDARRAAGLPVLSPAEYLATESSYRQIMSASGLPIGFYDQPSDFTDFLSKDISPTEVQGRVRAAADFVDQSDPSTKDFYSQWYSRGDMIASALDTTRAATVVEQRFKAATAAGAAQNAGMTISQQQAERVAAAGLSQAQTRAGVTEAANLAGNTARLGQIYGGTYNADSAISEVFFNGGAAAAARKKLSSQERGMFGGSDNTPGKSLSRRQAGQV